MKGLKNGYYENLKNGGTLHGDNMADINKQKRILQKNNGYGENDNRAMAGLASGRLLDDTRPSMRRELIQKHDQSMKMDKHGRLKMPGAYTSHDDLKKLQYSNADPRVDYNLDNNREELSETSYQSNVKSNIVNFYKGNRGGSDYLQMSKMPKYPNNPLMINKSLNMFAPYRNLQTAMYKSKDNESQMAKRINTGQKMINNNSLDSNWAKFCRGKLGTNAYLCCNSCNFVLCKQADVDSHAYAWCKGNHENGNRNFNFDEDDCDGGKAGTFSRLQTRLKTEPVECNGVF